MSTYKSYCSHKNKILSKFKNKCPHKKIIGHEHKNNYFPHKTILEKKICPNNNLNMYFKKLVYLHKIYIYILSFKKCLVPQKYIHGRENSK